MSTQRSLQTFPLHIIDSIIEYTMNTAEGYINHNHATDAQFFPHSCRALRMSFLKYAWINAYFGGEKYELSGRDFYGRYKCFQPPVYMYAEQVRALHVSVKQTNLDPSKINRSYKELMNPEYKDLLFTSARTLVVNVNIEQPSDDTSDCDFELNSEGEWEEIITDESDKYLDCSDVVDFIKKVYQLIRRLKQMAPNIKELYFRWSIADSSKTNKETSKLLGDMVTRITDGIRNISFYEYESRDVAYIRPSPLALTGLVHYSVSFNNKQDWLLEVVRRNADTLCKLTIKHMQAEQMRNVFKGKNRIPIIYPCLKELTSEWQGTYEAPAGDYEVIHFPVLEKLVVSDCCPIISKPFFNGGKSLKYVSIGMQSTALSSKNKYAIFDSCRLDKLQTFVLYQKKNHKYLAFHEAVNIEEIVLIVSILDTSPFLRSFAFQRDAKSDYFLHMILESFALSRIQKLDIGPTLLTLSQLEQLIQKAPQLQQLAYCLKPEDLSFESTMAQALCAFPLSQCLSKVLLNKLSCSQECLTNVLLYLVVACPRLANISMVDMWGCRVIIRMLSELAHKEPFSQYKDAIDSICTKVSEINSVDDYNPGQNVVRFISPPSDPDPHPYLRRPLWPVITDEYSLSLFCRYLQH